MSGDFTRSLALGPHDLFRLDTLCRPISESFGMCFLVGSVFTRRDPRDIDIRCMVADDDPLATPSTRRQILNAHLSASLQAATGLPIDFQFQGTTEGNAAPGKTLRSALGIGYEWRTK